NLREGVDGLRMPGLLVQVGAERFEALLGRAAQISEHRGDVEAQREPAFEGRHEGELPTPQLEELIELTGALVEGAQEPDGARVVRIDLEDRAAEGDRLGAVRLARRDLGRPEPQGNAFEGREGQLGAADEELERPLPLARAESELDEALEGPGGDLRRLRRANLSHGRV